MSYSTREIRGKSGSQAKPTGPLLKRHSLKLSQEVCADWLVCILWHLIGSDNLSFFFFLFFFFLIFFNFFFLIGYCLF